MVSVVRGSVEKRGLNPESAGVGDISFVMRICVSGNCAVGFMRVISFLQAVFGGFFPIRSAPCARYRGLLGSVTDRMFCNDRLQS